MTRRILIADSHPVSRAGYRKLLSELLSPVEFGEATSRRETLTALITGRWDAVILDLGLPDQPGLEVLQALKQHAPATPVLCVSSLPEEIYATEALRLGAAGFLSKASSPSELVLAIQRVMAGQRYVSEAGSNQMIELFAKVQGPAHERLSARETAVFRLLAAGKSLTLISQELHLSVKTISTYRSRILTKMGMRTNADIAAYAMRFDIGV